LIPRGLGVAGALGFLLAGLTKLAPARAAAALRPPGALPEAEFLSACVRCGLCVQDCPFDTLKLAQPEQPVVSGTPYFIARQVPCEMCEDIPCVKACPTGALDPGLTDITQAQMGVAVFVGLETCYAFQGMSCRACYMACPIRDEAITMKLVTRDHARVFMPTVASDRCTGCGKCEAACVTPEASIKVLPIALARLDGGIDAG